MIENTGRTVGYTLDNHYRLTSETVTGDPAMVNGTSDWEYDLVGNRLSQTSDISSVLNASETYSANNWLDSDVYDANGNTTASATYEAPVETLSDTYDWRNRLIRREKADGTVIEVIYDGFGDRVKKTVTPFGGLGESTWFLVDRNNLTGYAQVVEEGSQGGVIEVIYTYGLDLISQDRRDDDNSGNFTQSFYLYDGLGTVRALADDTGAVTDTYTYDAWGVEVASTGTTVNVFRFTGEQWDADLEMYFLRARYLNVATGRFHTMDTFEGVSTDPITLHKYLYANANPAMYTDPSGKVSLVQLSAGFFVAGVLFDLAARTIISRDNIDELKAFEENIIKRRFDPATCQQKYTAGSSIVLSATARNTANGVVRGIAKVFYLAAIGAGVGLAAEAGVISVSPVLVSSGGKIGGGLAAIVGFNALANAIEDGSEFNNKLAKWRSDCFDRRRVAIDKETGFPVIEIID